MQYITFMEALQYMCKLEKKWGLYFSYNEGVDLQEVLKAAPYLKAEHLTPSNGAFLFDTEKEMLKHFNMTVGDNGPTRTNSYDGPVQVYAVTCSPEGEIQDENT